MIVSVIGARPQFIKAAVVSQALKKDLIEEKIIHTGQHYDEKMSSVFWKELNLPLVDVNLGIGSGLQGFQTARIIESLEIYLKNLKKSPKAILLYGDTNSTLAGSLVGSKMHIPVIHVEAGLRSFNRKMPEEVNRVVTDHLSYLLFCSSKVGVKHLANEGITKNVFDVGDVMFDAIKIFSEYSSAKVRIENILPFKSEDFCILTLHRPSNTDNMENILSILSAIGKIRTPVIWPLHPRLKKKISSIKIPGNIFILDPLSYFEMLCVLKNCKKVFTDSGGLQKEAYWLKKPCITLRDDSEWVETLKNGWNQLCGASAINIIKAYSFNPVPKTWRQLYGDGNASHKIAAIIKNNFYT